MGWVRDLIKHLLDWFYEHTIEPIIDWLRDAILEIQVNLRNFMHTVKTWLAEWLENDWFFFLFVCATVVLVFTLPQIVTWITSTKAWATITAWVVALKDKVVKLIDIQKYIDLKLIDTLLKTFVKDYAEVRADMTKAVSGLAADFGEGTGFLHALIESARGTYMGTAAILGIDPRLTESEWYTDASNFVKNVNERFYHYARDPGAIYSDFFTEVLLPKAEEQREVNQQQLDQIRESYERLVEFETGLQMVNDSVELFISTMPAAIEEQFNRRWDDIEPVVDDLLETLRDEIIPAFESTVAAIEEHIAYQKAINEEVRRKLAKPVEVLGSFYMLPETEQEDTRTVVEDILIGELEDKKVEQNEANEEWQKRLSALLDDMIEPFYPSPALYYEPTQGIGGRRAPTVNIPSPFVGEY